MSFVVVSPNIVVNEVSGEGNATRILCLLLPKDGWQAS